LEARRNHHKSYYVQGDRQQMDGDLRAADKTVVHDRLYFPQLDGVRFLAFFLVLVHHFYPPANFFSALPEAADVIGVFKTYGWAGVDIFFVLSSFLICHLLLAERDRSGSISVRRFLIRRALRIWPLYFPYLILSMVIAPLFLSVGKSPEQYYVTLREHLFPFLSFLGNFSYAYFHQSLANVYFSHLWTVCLEEQFYFLIPILLTCWPIRWNASFLWCALAVLIFTMACRAYVLGNHIPYPMVWTNSLCRIDPFVIGAGCALLLRSKPAWMRRNVGGLLFAASVAGFALVTLFPDVGQSMQTIWQLLVVSVSAGCLVLSAMTPGGVGRFFARGYLPFLGKISFGLYVYHEVALDITARHLTTRFFLGANAASYIVDFAIALGLTTAVSAASYLIYERPILRFKERFEIIRSRPA
jgi:peptidoglycan/LPS O-acetylase OafA/YrhL